MRRRGPTLVLRPASSFYQHNSHTSLFLLQTPFNTISMFPISRQPTSTSISNSDSAISSMMFALSRIHICHPQTESQTLPPVPGRPPPKVIPGKFSTSLSSFLCAQVTQRNHTLCYSVVTVTKMNFQFPSSSFSFSIVHCCTMSLSGIWVPRQMTDDHYRNPNIKNN